jgi:DNA topoisomerase-1
MDKKLVIVESPTKAKTIEKYLGSGYKVIASNGHVRTLPEKELGIDIKNGFEPEYQIIKGKEKIVQALKAELKLSSELILATDEDREGESISWHLMEILKPKVKTRRMVFHEITKSAIEEAIANGRDIDMNLVNAQEARRLLDRLFGFYLSPVLWSRLSNKNLSAGRVQSPGLRLIVDRERTRIAFKKSSFWDLKANLLAQKGSFDAKLDSVNGKRIVNSKDFDSETGELKSRSSILYLDETQAQKLVADLKDATWIISQEAGEKTVRQQPYPPFTTSTLQQEANRKLHFSAKDTMRIAQSLYENGYITYMRTDSPALSNEGTSAARNAVERLYGTSYLSENPRHFVAKTAGAQEAHEAIRPSGNVFRDPDSLGIAGKERALYELIWKRTLACQMADARKINTTLSIEATKGSLKADFSASGTRIEFPGFIRVYFENSDDPDAAMEDTETLLPKVSAGESLSLNSLASQAHETKAPARFTEASLVQKLESLGIGRPSTYATIIDRLMEKSYIIKESSALVPTFIGFGVIQLLEGHFQKYVDYSFTSGMEEGLDLIADDKLDKTRFLEEFFSGKDGLSDEIANAKKEIVSKEAKRIELSQLDSGNSVFIGPFGPYVLGPEDKAISVPTGWMPGTVTNEDIEALKKTEGANNPKPQAIGTSEDGQTIYRCTGRYGDYWQKGSNDQPHPRRFSIPKPMLDKEVSIEFIDKCFTLPVTIGQDPDGVDVVLGNGKFGPFINRGSDYRSVKSLEILFDLSLEGAITLLSQPKPERKAKGSARKASDSPKPEVAAVIPLGEYQGQSVGIFYGRYGFYLKHGKTNVVLPAKCKESEKECRNMTLEDAIALIDSKAQGKKA